MELFNFRKELADKLLEAIASEQPISVPENGWSRDDLLHLSAVALVLASEEADINRQARYEVGRHAQAKGC
jgi:hypothetical protein